MFESFSSRTGRGESRLAAASRFCLDLASRGELDPSQIHVCADEGDEAVRKVRGRVVAFDSEYSAERNNLECAALTNSEKPHKVEGGSFFYPFKIPVMRTLLRSYLSGVEWGKQGTVYKVGFNMEHGYSKRAAQYLAERWSGRFDVTFGDSLVTLQEDNGAFDVVFIDGGHTEEIAYSDIINLRTNTLSSPGPRLVIMDDVNQDEVGEAWDRARKEGIVEEIGNSYEDAFYDNARTARSSLAYGIYL
ncbi:hypothetical protein TrLO_g15903 [Triparma laevis f. longispina]|uniref:Uncharacterized protein n=1 Tax=Triparma laevis f. longispina TaxID=1714387 RepID=A0A9W6ZTL4_9STRA|nr:hypothetical protein TrLO_g15903 [Triparma laevis f. longispina]